MEINIANVLETLTMGKKIEHNTNLVSHLNILVEKSRWAVSKQSFKGQCDFSIKARGCLHGKTVKHPFKLKQNF